MPSRRQLANIMKAPPMPMVPEQAHGTLVVMALLCWAGDLDAGERVVARFRELATPIADLVRPMPSPRLYPPEEEGYHPTAVGHNLFLDTLDEQAARTILEHLAASTAPLAVAHLGVLGGAMARVPAEATAFAHRASRLMVHLAALYQ